MISRSNPYFVNLNHKLSEAAGLFTATVGIIVLCGWALDNPYLKSLHPSFVSMKANTALCFLLAGISLWLKSGQENKSWFYGQIADICACVVFLIGFLTLCEYFPGMDFGIDQIFFKEPAGATLTVIPGRMAPNTAIAFILSGTGLWAIDFETKKIRPAEVMMLLVWLTGFFALIGYAFESASLYGIAHYTRMALPTAIAFVALGTGGLTSRIEKGALAVLVSRGNGGSVARLLSPIAILTPVLLGLLRLEGQLLGLYDMNFGIALFAISMVILFSVAVFWCSRIVERADARQEAVEDDLRRTTEELDRFFTLTLDLLCIASIDGRFIRLNRAWENILGYSIEELEGKIFLELVHPDDINDTLAAIQDLSDQKTINLFINRYRHKNGSYRFIEWSSVPCGSLIYAAARDITDRRQAEENLLKANTELEAFAYSISHDLRAPLRAIDGFTRILEEDYGSSLDVEAKRVCSVIRKNAGFMGRLIDDLLAFSRLGRSDLKLFQIDMEKKVNSVFQELTTPESRKRIDFRVDPLPFAVGDRTLIRQVMTNLVSNAIKFSSRREQAIIRVTAEKRNNEVIYCVSDNGAGFDKNYADKLFGVFQRLHSVREFEGTGVGLAIVQRIIHRHGGRIWAESELNKGATFCFALPIKGE